MSEHDRHDRECKGHHHDKPHHGHHDHHEEFVRLHVELEKDQIAELEKVAREYASDLKQDWDVSAVIRVAVGAFLNKLGRIV
jgi:hypothetical protein